MSVSPDRAFFGEVDPDHHEKCGMTTKASSPQWGKP
jgi:hypothetical protein